jgi:DNA-directed RNA polymerase subunit H (RpoH/RPB5)
MSPEEVETLFRRGHIVRSDLATILSNDAPIIWNGGREGQVVEITRDSQTAGTALYYRRIERAPI